jgi:outer membrane receptor protein involved in Fe transport
MLSTLHRFFLKGSRTIRYRTTSIVLILAIIIGCPVLSEAQSISKSKINVSFQGETLKEALRKIEALSIYHFVFFDEEINHVPTINKRFENKDISEILNELLLKYKLTYKQVGNNIIINTVKDKLNLKGKISGSVKDANTGDLLIGVAVSSETGQGTITGEDGNYVLELDEGQHTLEIRYIGYLSITKEVTIKADRTKEIDIALNEDKNSLTEINVVDRRITQNQSAVIHEIREARSIVSGISGEQIRRTQDRDAAEVIRRIPGISVIQNRFIVIRGLPFRYNAVLLNNALAPSFEADTRAFSFDIVPSSTIDRIMVYKTAAPELPGDFAGGAVKVYTVGLPSKDGLNITYQASYRPNTTSRDFYEQPQGKNAWLGYDDGTYAMPKGVPKRIEDNNRAGLIDKFNTNWDANKKTATPDQRLNIDFAKRIKVSDKVKFGVVGGINYSNTYQYNVVSKNISIFQYEPYNSFGEAYTFSEQVYQHNARLNGLLNLSLDINGKHQIDFKNIYTHLGSFEYLDRRGKAGLLAGDGAGLGTNQLIHQSVMTNNFKSIFASQLNGTHKLSEGTKLSWLAGYTKSLFSSPDQRTRTRTLLDDSTQLTYTGEFIETVGAGGINQNRYSRYYYTLPEETRTFGLDLEQVLKINNFSPTIKGGIYYENKDRTFELRVLGLMQAFGSNDVVMGESYYPWNSYTASNLLKAGYLAAEIPFLKKFKLYGGVRVEDNQQQLHSYTQANGGGVTGKKVDLDNHIVSYLPSFNLSYSLTDKSLLRAAYSKTLNRPEFREIAPFWYLDMQSFNYVYGNPDIIPQADISNYDLRFEYYPGPSEMVTFGLFYKDFLNPFEFYYYSSTANRNSFIWGNAQKATNYGAEVDMYLSLGRLSDKSAKMSKVLDKFALLFNAAYIFSEVKLRDDAALIQKAKRPLFGQSPYVINVGLNYTNDSIGIKANVSYNIIGKRIVAVGNIDYPDTYDMPRNSLDLTFSKRIFKKLQVSAGVQNILNARFWQAQDGNGDGKFTENKTPWVDNVFQSFYTGTYYTLGISAAL